MNILHYVNQFFGGIGGEDRANEPARVIDSAVGPGRALQAALGKDATIRATLIAGDNFAVENEDALKKAVLDAVHRYAPAAIAAGPAFDSGRYGLACGQVSRIATEAGIPVVTAMSPDNAGIVTYRRWMICLPTGVAVAEMPAIVKRMAPLLLKLGSGAELGPAAVEGYLPRGVRKPALVEKIGAARAVDMALARIRGKPFQSEIVIQDYDHVAPPPPLPTLRGVKVAIVTSGGLVPTGNPDKLSAARADAYFEYSITGMTELKVGDWETIHGGYGHKSVNEIDPNYVVPLRSLRVLESQGEIGSLFDHYISTVGNQTSIANARRFGKALVERFKAAGVGAVVMIPT